MLGERPGKASPGHFTAVARMGKDEVALPGEGEGRAVDVQSQHF